MPIMELLLATVTVSMAIIIGLLVALLRKSTGTDVRIMMTTEFDQAIERLDAAIKHHTDVAAVVEMVRQLDANPDALELIKSYPETVRAAAWLHYINALGSDLQDAQKRLSVYHRMYSMTSLTVQDAQRKVDALRNKLHAAIKASGQTNVHVL